MIYSSIFDHLGVGRIPTIGTVVAMEKIAYASARDVIVPLHPTRLSPERAPEPCSPNRVAEGELGPAGVTVVEHHSYSGFARVPKRNPVMLRIGFGETSFEPTRWVTNRFDSRRNGLAVGFTRQTVKDQTPSLSILESRLCDGPIKRRIGGVGGEFSQIRLLTAMSGSESSEDGGSCVLVWDGTNDELRVVP